MKITKWKEIHQMLNSLLSLFVIVLVQLCLSPLLLSVLGDYRESNLVCILFFQLGLLIGETGYVNKIVQPLFTFLIMLTLSVYGYLYQYHTYSVLKFVPGQWAVIFMFFICSLISGNLLHQFLFASGTFKKNYFLSNLISMILVVLWIIISPPLGISMILIGVLVFILSVFKQKNENYQILNLTINKILIETFFQGFLISTYIAIFFDILNLFCYPSGFEYYLYLFFIFLLMTLSCYFFRYRKYFDSINAITMGIMSFLFIIIYLFLGSENYFFINPIDLYQNLSVGLRSYEIVASICLLFLLIPYFFFSFSFPFRQMEMTQKNHLFATSLGGFCATMIMVYPMADFELKYKISFLLVIFLSLLLFHLKPQPMRIVIFLGTLVLAAIIINSDLDRRIILQGQKLRPVFRQAKDLRYRKDYEFAPLQISNVVRKKGQVGFIYNDFFDKRLYLGLNSYTANINNDEDRIRGLEVAKILPNKKLKILIIGLGNHLLLKNLIENIPQGIDYQVDVIDSFQPFSNNNFLKNIGTKNNYFWGKNANVKLFIADAFVWLLGTPDKYYDIIASNLTSPHYVPSQRLFTKEFGEMLSHALKDDGFYVNEIYFNKIIDCPARMSFPFAWVKVLNENEGFIVASKKNNSNGYFNHYFNFPKEQCSNINISSLTTPVRNLKFIWDYKKKDLVFKKMYIHFYNDHPELKNQKILHLQNTVDFFSSLHPEIKMDTGLDKNMDDHVRKINEAIDEKKGNDIIFAPMGSEASDQLMNKFKNKWDSMLFSQVTASSKLHYGFKTLSTFFPAKDYLKNVLPLVTNSTSGSQKIFILRDSSTSFYKEIEDGLIFNIKKELQTTPELFLGTHQQLIKYLNKIVSENKIRINDILIVLDSDLNPKEFKFSLNASYLLKNIFKIYIYGDESLENDLTFASNSVFSLFWHKDLDYSYSQNFNQCQYVKLYKQKYNRNPDFHSAFLFANMQIAAQSNSKNIQLLNTENIETILGTFRWDNFGFPQNRVPVYLKFDNNGKGKYYVSKTPNKICNKLDFPIIHFPD